MARIKKPIAKNLEDDDDGEDFSEEIARANDLFREIESQAWKCHPEGADKTLRLTEQSWNVVKCMIRFTLTVADANDVASRRRLATLEQRIAALEIGHDYRSIWVSGQTYHKGNTVTDHGVLWIVTADSTTDRPGKSADWKLIAKSGERRAKTASSTESDMGKVY